VAEVQRHAGGVGVAEAQRHAGGAVGAAEAVLLQRHAEVPLLPSASGVIQKRRRRWILKRQSRNRMTGFFSATTARRRTSPEGAAGVVAVGVAKVQRHAGDPLLLAEIPLLPSAGDVTRMMQRWIRKRQSRNLMMALSTATTAHRRSV